MPLLPVELTEEIIDIVAECYPESLPGCALVAHQWYPRSTHHLYRIFRRPAITTFDALHVFFSIVGRHRRLASIAISLEVTPDPESSLSFGSYIPFHHLSTNVLPNVRQLVLGETLRWSDYPLLYCNSTVGFTFHAVTALDLSCHFKSVSDLLHLIRSFRNVEEVRLHYSHQYPPRWMLSPPLVPSPKRNHLNNTFRLQNLELPLVVLKPVLDVCGDFVVNLSVLCPRISAIVSMNAAESDKELVLRCSLTSLLTVKIEVPVESDGTANYAGLQELGPLSIAPLTKPNVLYSLFLCCPLHTRTVQHNVAVDASATQLQEHIQTFIHTDSELGVVEECSACSMENLHDVTRSKDALLVGITYATNVNLTDAGFPIQMGARRDVMALQKLLRERYGYRDDNITTLVDSEDVPASFWPTRENIIDAMEKLISGKQAGDHIVFSYVGHSSQIAAPVDANEADGMDEILLPVDCIYDSESPDAFVNFIRDDEIRDIFVNRLPEGVHCTMIFDCSHSGTMADLPNVQLWDESDFELPAPAVRSKSMLQLDMPHARPTAGSLYPPSLLYLEKEVTSWSACMDDQVAFGKKSGSIFTKAFTEILYETPNPTHKQLLKELRKRMVHVTEAANKRLRARRVAGGPPEKVVYEDYTPPIPQLGSLRPDSILLDTFTL